MSEVKPIQIKQVDINPEFLVNLNSRKSKTQKKRPSIPTVKPNELKKSLLHKIRNHRINANIKARADSIQNSSESTSSLDNSSDPQNQINSPKPSLAVETSISKKPAVNFSNNSNLNSSSQSELKSQNDNEYQDSINFLQQLSSKKNKKLKSKSQPLIINASLAPTNFDNDENNMKMIISEKSEETSNENQISDSDPQTPPYSCLKNGSKPTYREWRGTKKNGGLHSKSILLGKQGRKVGILIKNSETRKKIHSEHSSLLKKVKIHEMKKYLKNHNLLKSGSHAPPDVIKKMYEQSILSGEIKNSNKDNIIHNYLKE